MVFRVQRIFRSVIVVTLISIMVLITIANNRTIDAVLNDATLDVQVLGLVPKSGDIPKRPDLSGERFITNMPKLIQSEVVVELCNQSFRYLINPSDICIGQDVYLIIYVHSKPSHFQRRQTIRDTWGNSSLLNQYKAKLVFILGTDQTTRYFKQIVHESESHGDIVQGNFMDAYRNLTYKAITGIRWVSAFCPNASFVLKTDDDILVNLHLFMTFLTNNIEERYGRKELILCNKWSRMQVTRNPKSKWYVSREEFPDEFYKPFCSGSAYLMSMDVVETMYKISKQTPFFWVDDYYVTGMLVNKMKIAIRENNNAYDLSYLNLHRNIKLLFYHIGSGYTARLFWHNITKAYESNVLAKMGLVP